ncbi:hypothetical protein [Streptomyces axinellae]|uniref:DUF732 domain-containing protein n=1 Tax=Streptomyces axinellae TaxID=552788 RepID=A0ABN3PPT4_9ACTN
MSISSRAAAVVVAVVIAGCATACGGDGPGAPSSDRSGPGSPGNSVTSAPVGIEDPSTSPKDLSPTPIASDRAELTEGALDESWSAAGEADKDALCDGLRMFGTAWVAQQMRENESDEDVDWDYAALLVKGKCEARS